MECVKNDPGGARITDPDTRLPLAALESLMRRRFRVRETEVPVKGGIVRIIHPASADDLISEDDYVRDERLPYWADLWPSSIALAGIVHELLPRQARVLELGCGAGLVSSAAARLGHDLLATDYYTDALSFTRVNAWRNSDREIDVRHVDWREFPGELRNFDVVLASDVIYEKPNAALVAEAIRSALAPDGVAFVADPGRTTTNAFLEACGAAKLSIEARSREPFVEGEISQIIMIWEIRHRR